MTNQNRIIAMAISSFLYVTRIFAPVLWNINRLFLLGDSSSRVRVFGTAPCSDSERV